MWSSYLARFSVRGINLFDVSCFSKSGCDVIVFAAVVYRYTKTKELIECSQQDS